MEKYRKAIVAVVGAAVAVAAVFGVVVPEDAADAVVTVAVLLTALLVERVPNA